MADDNQEAQQQKYKQQQQQQQQGQQHQSNPQQGQQQQDQQQYYAQMQYEQSLQNDSHSVILVTAGYDNTVRFWEALSGICSKTIKHPDSVSHMVWVCVCVCVMPDWIHA